MNGVPEPWSEWSAATAEDVSCRRLAVSLIVAHAPEFSAAYLALGTWHGTGPASVLIVRMLEV